MKYKWSYEDNVIITLAYINKCSIECAQKLLSDITYNSIKMKYANCLYLEKGLVKGALSNISKQHQQIWDLLNEQKNEQKSISISELEYFEKRIGVDVGYNDNLPHPDYPDSTSTKGFDKNLQLEEIIKLAKDINGNIIIKAGKNAKWYIKKINLESIDELIEKQNKWRDTSRYTMYIVKFT